MLDVTNLSSFALLTFGALDTSDELSEVVVAKGGYTLRPVSQEGRETDAPSDVSLEFLFDETLTSLFVQDECFGAVNRTSVRTESDLAPFKPRCDVILIGSAHSPTGRPTRDMIVGIDIDRGRTRVHSHSLRIHGERDLIRRDAFDRGAAALVWLATAGSVEAPEWYLSEPEPFSECKLRYELAFGGEARVAVDNECAERVAAENRLDDEVRQEHPDGAGAPIAHRVCVLNPVGRGFVEQWHVKATRSSRYPAPRIEAESSPFTPQLFHALLHGHVECGSDPGLTPQGFGFITKAWQPRLKLAGTYDEIWRAERWPNLPPDFDMAFWNGAHPSMQCEYLRGGESITLTNLLPRGALGTRTQPDATIARLRLPVVELALRLELEDGRTTYGLMPIDTLTLDLEAMVVHIVWRLRIPEGLPARDAVLISLAEIRATEMVAAEAI